MSLFRWLKKDNSNRIDPDELLQKAEESIRITRAQQSKVNIITSYLQRRDGQNGFGEDFQFTFHVKGAK